MKTQFLIILTLLFCSPLLWSQDDFNTLDKVELKKDFKKHPILTNQFYFDAGFFVLSKDIKVGASGELANNEIDFGKTFKLDDSENSYFFKFDWRFHEKWKLSAETFRMKRKNGAVLKEDIQWRDVVFESGTNVQAGFELNLYRVFIGHLITRGLKHEFGGGLGVHALDIEVFLEGDVLSSIGDLNFERRSVNAVLPLPNIGLWYYFAPNDKWAFVARLDWFGVKIDEYSGNIWDIAPGIKYQVFKNVALGIDYRYFTVNADVDKSNWKGSLDLGFQGPLFLINVNF